MTTAVRHCMECRFQRFDISKTSLTPSQQSKTSLKDPIESILELTYLLNSPQDNNNDENIETLLLSFIKNSESVLQDIDIQRLRAILYRDVVRQDRSKTGKNVVVVVVNPSNIFILSLLYVFCVALIVFFLFVFNEMIRYLII
jgi:hypothetical protein